MILLRISNQNGAPSETAHVVSRIPMIFSDHASAPRGIVAEVRLPFHVGVSVELPIPVLERLAESTLAEAQRV